MIFGPALLLFCDGLILALDNHFVLPINSVTAIFGVPFIIWIILKQGK
jgi:iron complex transport system permease protein